MPFNKLSDVKECKKDDTDHEKKKKLLKEKAARRQLLRNYFQKQHSDPFRHAAGEGGTVDDPAIVRYHAMKFNQYDYFKPSFSNVLRGIFLIVLPMVGYGYLMHQERMEKEHALRSGQVAYANRIRKFI